MLYGSWPVEQPADQIRTGPAVGSRDHRGHAFGHESEVGRLAEEGRVVDRAQVDQQLHPRPGRLGLENPFVPLSETDEPLFLQARTKPRLEQAQAVRLQGDADLIAQKEYDRSKILLRPGIGRRTGGAAERVGCRHVRIPRRSAIPEQRRHDPHPVRARTPPGDG